MDFHHTHTVLQGPRESWTAEAAMTPAHDPEQPGSGSQGFPVHATAICPQEDRGSCIVQWDACTGPLSWESSALQAVFSSAA